MKFRLASITLPRWEAILTRCLLAWLLLNALPGGVLPIKMFFDNPVQWAQSLLHAPVSAPPWNTQPHPAALGQFFDFSWLSQPETFKTVDFFARLGIIAFALGILPIFGLCAFFVLDISLHTLATSQGVQGHGAQINALLALGLLGGYLWHVVSRWRIWNPLHQPLFLDTGSAANTALQGARITLAATYVVSGLSKLTKGGLDWPLRGDSFVLQILKAQDEMRATHLEQELTPTAVAFGEFLAAHTWLASLMLCGALALELGAFLALFGRRWALAVGIGLLVFHKSNHWLMGLPFKGNQWALWFLYIMPLFWFVAVPQFITKRRWTPSPPFLPSKPLWQRVVRHPAVAALLIALFLLWRGDWYPFSNFPMYSSLRNSTNSLLVTDMQGNLIPFEKLGTNAPTVKKLLRTELKILREAGEFRSFDDIPADTHRRAIQKVVDAMMAVPDSEFTHHQAFRIIQKDYHAVDGEVKISTLVLGEFPATDSPPSAAPGLP